MKKTIKQIRIWFYFILEIMEMLINLLYSILDLFLPKKQFQSDFQILLIPGFFGNRLFYNKIKKKFEKEGLRVAIADFYGITFNEKKRVNQLSEILKNCQNKITIIAHNTGGLIAMVLPDSSRQKIDTFITLGTPFYGSYLFNFTSLLGFFPNWKYNSDYLQKILNNALLFNYFFPFSPIRDISFPPNKNTEFGQGRDWWFDIPGNLNLVRRNENLRTLVEFVKSTPSFKSDFEISKHVEMEPNEKKVLKKNKRIKKPVIVKSKSKSKKTSISINKKSKIIKAKKRK